MAKVELKPLGDAWGNFGAEDDIADLQGRIQGSRKTAREHPARLNCFKRIANCLLRMARSHSSQQHMNVAAPLGHSLKGLCLLRNGEADQSRCLRSREAHLIPARRSFQIW